MKLSTQGRAMIQAFEGRRLKVYRDSAGLLTAGIGHLLDQDGNWNEGDAVPAELVDQWFDADLAVAEATVNHWTIGLNQPQFDALVSFVFNLGPAPLEGDTGISSALGSRYYADAAREIRRWHYATVNGKKVSIPGLVARREAEARLFETGVYPETAALPPKAARPTLRRGSSGPAVLDLTRALFRLGFMSFPSSRFGSKTEWAVKQFQLTRGLVQDGICGKNTWAALEAAAEESRP